MKLKKLNNKGFVLAETLVVTIFLMTIFTMIYTYFYPLIGEYEKRENYDDVDSIYAIYWIKRMIEDPSYNITSNQVKRASFTDYGYFKFDCSDIINDYEKRETCKVLVNALQVENCDGNGDGCNIYVTKYRIGGTGNSFKNTVRDNRPIIYENCSSQDEESCRNEFLDKCYARYSESGRVDRCDTLVDSKAFRSGFQEYVLSLPDYGTLSQTGEKYRVIASFRHTLDNNNYYTYATIEVNK